MLEKNRRLLPFVTIVLALLLGFFVWPTMYRYDKMNQKWPVRINRITGKTEVLYQSGWQSVGNVSPSGNYVEKQSEMTDSRVGGVMVNDIDVKVKWNILQGTASGEVINTSKNVISLGTLNVTLYDANGNVLPNQPSGKIFYSSELNPGESEPFLININADSIYKYRVKLTYTSKEKN